MKPATQYVFLIIMIFFGRAFSDENLPQPSEKCTQLETGLIEACLDKANASTDKALNQVYQNIMKQLKPDEKKELRDTQRAWLKTRTAQCDTLTDKLKIKACYLDMTGVKINELHEKSQDLKPKLFEGIWKSCFNFNKSDGELYQRYGGEPICTSSYYLQQGENICGIRESWASGRLYRKKIHYKLIGSTSAQSKKLCEDEGGSATIKCYVDQNNYDSDDETKEQKDYKDWEDNNRLAIKICNKQLSEGGIYLLDSDYCEASKKEGGGGKRQLISALDKKQTLQKNPWLLACLNDKEK